MSNAQETGSRYSDRIVRDPQVCGGQAVIKGTRVTLRTVLASLADGDSIEEILEAFPTLKPEDVRAAIAFAAASAEEDLPVPAVPPDSMRIKLDENPPSRPHAPRRRRADEEVAIPRKGPRSLAVGEAQGRCTSR